MAVMAFPRQRQPGERRRRAAQPRRRAAGEGPGGRGASAGREGSAPDADPPADRNSALWRALVPSHSGEPPVRAPGRRACIRRAARTAIRL
jgi:hypothetical protein